MCVHAVCSRSAEAAGALPACVSHSVTLPSCLPLYPGACPAVHQVVESLLQPATLERLKAIRRYVEQQDGEFPPAPTAVDVPVPLYGYTRLQALEWWKPRQIDDITFRAIEMLYSPRQLMYYWNDMDLPWCGLVSGSWQAVCVSERTNFHLFKIYSRTTISKASASGCVTD